MKKSKFVEDLRPKEEVQESFLIKHFSLGQGRDGKSFLNIILSDKTGDLESRVWTRAEELLPRLQKNRIARVAGKLNLFQGRRQFIISDLDIIDEAETNDLSDFVATSLRPAQEMFQALLKIIDELDDYYIKKLLSQVLDDAEIKERLMLCPAGKTIHHAYQGGLLEHILSCAHLSISLSQHYRVNKNYVVAGAVLHDLCKIFELSDEPSVEYTDEGKLVGHLVKSVELIDHFSTSIENFPEDLKMHLKHICLAHHGELAYGSPKLPQTSEAFLVHLIDFMDSKMDSLETIKKTDQTPGDWSQFVRHLDRTIYKSPLPFYPSALQSDTRPASTTTPKNNQRYKDSAPSPSMGKLFKDLKLKD